MQPYGQDATTYYNQQPDNHGTYYQQPPPQPPYVGGVVGQQILGPASAGGTEQEFLDKSHKYNIKYKGAFAAVEVAITPNDGIKAQAGAMVTLSNNVDIAAQTEGGVGNSLVLACCTNESFFFSNFSLKPGGGNRGDVLLAPGPPGEIILLELDGSTGWSIQKGGFLACDSSVNINARVQGFVKGCCSGLGFFIMEATGAGRLLLNSFGSIIRYDVAPGEVRTIDNGFIVAWTSTMPYEIGTAATSLGASFFSGEGLVTRFTGPGTLYVQTRSIKGLADALRPYLPSGGGGGNNAGSY